MYCKKYSAEIPEKTCFLRFGEVKYFSGKGMHKFDGCKNCEEGKKVYEIQLKNNKNIDQKPKGAEKECVVCCRIMGASMFGDSGKNKTCIECEESAQDKETNLVKTKTCSSCGMTLSVEFFYNNKSKKDQLSDWCKACTKVRNKQYKKSKQKPGEINVPKERPEIKEEEKTSGDSVLIIDFSPHKNLLERLKKKAESEFRTVEQQILFDCSALTK